MSNIIQCKMCGGLFESLGGKVCGKCLEQIDKDFVKIRNYLYEYPGKSSVDEICEGTEVSQEVVLHLIKEKRLTSATPSGGALTCKMCQKPISSGSMCDACKLSLANSLQSSLPKAVPEKKQPKGSNKSRMHIDFGKGK